MSKILNKILNENAIEKSLEDAIEMAIGDRDWMLQGSVVNDVGSDALVQMTYAGQNFTAALERTKLGTWNVWAWNPRVPYMSGDLN